MCNRWSSSAWRCGRADDRETGVYTLPLTEKSASQAWLGTQPRFSLAAWEGAAKQCLATFNPLFTLSSNTHSLTILIGFPVSTVLWGYRWGGWFWQVRQEASLDVHLNSRDSWAEERTYCKERTFQALECHEQGKGRERRGGQGGRRIQVRCGEWRGWRLVRGGATFGGL